MLTKEAKRSKNHFQKKCTCFISKKKTKKTQLFADDS